MEEYRGGYYAPAIVAALKEKQRNYSKEYYQNNKERIQKKSRENYQNNKHYWKNYDQEQKEVEGSSRTNEYKRAYYQKNKERIKEQARVRRAKKKAELKAEWDKIEDN